jgi:hypothetical protein
MRHPQLKCVMLFETGVWLAGFVIQATGFTRALEMPPWFFIIPVNDIGYGRGAHHDIQPPRPYPS